MNHPFIIQPTHRFAQPKGLLTALVLLAALLMTLPSPAAMAGNPTDPCSIATTVDAGVTPIRGEKGRTKVYRLHIPARGAIAVDAATSIAKPERLRVERINAICPDNASRLSVVRETPRGLILHAHEAGAVYFQITSEHPGKAFGDAELHVAYAAEPEIPGVDWTLDVNPPAACAASDVPSLGSGDEDYVVVRRIPELTKDVEPEECDVLERTFTEPGLVIFEAEGVPVDATLFSANGCATPIAEGRLGDAGQSLMAPVLAGSHRIDLASTTSDLTYALTVKHLPLCPPAHAGLARCATILEADALHEGTLTGNREEAYTFELESLTTVSIAIQGGPVDGALYNGQDVRLAPRVHCHRAGCGLITTLPKGRYGLRLAGRDGESVDYAVSWTRLR